MQWTQQFNKSKVETIDHKNLIFYNEDLILKIYNFINLLIFHNEDLIMKIYH